MLKKRTIIPTEDGTKTLYVSELNEAYHSSHGALQEAQHVFIKNGLAKILQISGKEKINILEMGFGTGLNALATAEKFLQEENPTEIQYFGIEKYPVSQEEIEELAYGKFFQNEKEMSIIFQKIHQTKWNETVEILPNFHLNKIKIDFFEIVNLHLPPLDLVYFDCFAPKVQPDLWEKPLLEMVVRKMAHNSLLTTYSCKGSVRRILSELGLAVEKMEGAKGKREMINAWKRILTA